MPGHSNAGGVSGRHDGEPGSSAGCPKSPCASQEPSWASQAAAYSSMTTFFLPEPPPPSTASALPGSVGFGAPAGWGASMLAGALAFPASAGFRTPAGGGGLSPASAVALSGSVGFGAPASWGASMLAGALAFPASAGFRTPAGGGLSPASALAISSTGWSGALAARSSAAGDWSVSGASVPPLPALGSPISLMTLPAQSAQPPPRVHGPTRIRQVPRPMMLPHMRGRKASTTGTLPDKPSCCRECAPARTPCQRGFGLVERTDHRRRPRQ